MFDEHGYYIGKKFPKSCIEDCTRPGSCDDAVEYWQKKLNFNVPRDLAISYLKEFGAWEIEELNEMDDITISQYVLWIACGDIKENGEWLGLVH